MDDLNIWMPRVEYCQRSGRCRNPEKCEAPLKCDRWYNPRWDGSPSGMATFLMQSHRVTDEGRLKRIAALEDALGAVLNHVCACVDPACQCPICAARKAMSDVLTLQGWQRHWESVEQKSK